MKKGILGILAHVDAGKTTLSEELLYKTGAIRQKGSVDGKDTVMDSDPMEAARGITIYSAEADIQTDRMHLTLLDTPGHVDFSGETERTLAVLDAAILVVSGLDGIQSHTRTLWDLLRKNHVPTFVFLNKMDIAVRPLEELLGEMKTQLSDGAIPFYTGGAVDESVTESEDNSREGSSGPRVHLSEDVVEDIASLDEDLMETYLDTGEITSRDIQRLIQEEKLFPVISGSARLGEGTEELLSILEDYLPEKTYPEDFGALCYKVDRDNKGNRLTFLKITGGSLKNRMEIQVDEEKTCKVTEIRVYRGENYDVLPEAGPGSLVAVTGIDGSLPGRGYGIQGDLSSRELEPVFRYEAIPEGAVSSHTLLVALRELEEEDPLLDVTWDQKKDRIQVRLMGEIQKEVLIQTLKSRFDVPANFIETSVTYRETLEMPVEGHGHFEPLRHFADVWIRVEPLPAGSGISAISECPTDELDENYQRQILRTLMNGRHTGVLLNEPLTDVRFVLTHGKSHTKHTEGGDFRKATNLAVRDAQLHGMCRILEPYYHIRLSVPNDKMGRAMTDLTNMHGTIEPPIQTADGVLLEGLVPVSEIAGYQAKVTSYTGGLGQLSLEPGGYHPCHNEDEVLARSDYNFRTDPKNPYQSIYVHQEIAPLDPDLDGRHPEAGYGYDRSVYISNEMGNVNQPQRDQEGRLIGGSSWWSENAENKGSDGNSYDGYGGLESDLQEIFERTYGKIERKDLGQSYVIESEKEPEETVEEAKASYLAAHPKEVERREKRNPAQAKRKRYVLVDGYNVIYQMPELYHLSQEAGFDAARGRLLDLLANYQGYLDCECIVVFDAYKVKGNPGSTMKWGEVYVVYTREAQTADAYIERATHVIAHRETADIAVVTSDGAEQMIVAGEGARRISSREFEAELQRVNGEGMDAFHRMKQ